MVLCTLSWSSHGLQGHGSLALPKKKLKII